MELCDDLLFRNKDWDPSYLTSIFDQDFYEYSDLWDSNMSDKELLQEVTKIDVYSPIVEDISMDDLELCTAVENIERRYSFNLFLYLLRKVIVARGLGFREFTDFFVF